MADSYKDLSHTAAQIDSAIDLATNHVANTSQHITETERMNWNAKADTSAVYSRTEVDDLLAGKASQSDMESAQSSISSLQTGQTAHDDALVRLVDNSGKNRIILGFPATTRNAVTATPNDDGTITVSGTNSSSSNTVLVFDLWGDASVSSANKQNPFTENGTYIMKGTGSNDIRLQLYGYNDDLQLNPLANSASDVEVTVDGTYKYYVFRIWIKGSATFDDLTLYPMCCLKAYHDISSAFRPYVPTNAELYSMIKASEV